MAGLNNEPKTQKRRVGDGTPGPGRPKGVPNKATATMKAAIQSVYDELQKKSGKPHGHFLAWAQDNETEFYKLASKLLPIQTEITGKDGEDIAIRQVNDDADAVTRRLTAGLAAAGIARTASSTVQ